MKAFDNNEKAQKIQCPCQCHCRQQRKGIADSFLFSSVFLIIFARVIDMKVGPSRSPFCAKKNPQSVMVEIRVISFIAYDAHEANSFFASLGVRSPHLVCYCRVSTVLHQRIAGCMCRQTKGKIKVDANKHAQSTEDGLESVPQIISSYLNSIG